MGTGPRHGQDIPKGSAGHQSRKPDRHIANLRTGPGAPVQDGRIMSEPTDRRDAPDRIQWLELFFDLVVVAAVAVDQFRRKRRAAAAAIVVANNKPARMRTYASHTVESLA